MALPLRIDKTVIVGLIGALVLCVISYLNVVDGAFQFDDEILIMKLSALEKEHGEFSWDALRAFVQGSSRPVADLTFGLNYQYAGHGARSYHLTNLLIHLINGVLIYVLVSITLCAPRLQGRYDELSQSTALLAAALFLLHPLQTQAVSYITQRYASLAALFYLLALIMYIMAVSSGRSSLKTFCYSVAAMGFVLGLMTKLTVITAPVVMMMYDYYFLRQRPALKRLAFPLLLLGVSLVSGTVMLLKLTALAKSSVGFQVGGITPWEYLLTQSRVVALYIKLFFIPVGQNLDYAFEPSRSLLEFKTLLSFTGVLAGAALAVLCRRTWPVVSFSALWFLVILLPTSSIIPVVDLAVEHRVYLASLGVFLPVSLVMAHALHATDKVRRRIAIVLVLCVLLSLSALTHLRNRVWITSISMWEDVVSKSPLKDRGYYNLGNAYREHGFIDRALESYGKAVKLNPNNSTAYNNIGNSYVYFGRIERAIDAYKKAIETDRRNFEAYYNLAVNLEKEGRLHEAGKYYREFAANAPEAYAVQKKNAMQRAAALAP